MVEGIFGGEFPSTTAFGGGPPPPAGEDFLKIPE